MNGVVSLLIIDLLTYHLIYHLSYLSFSEIKSSFCTILIKDINDITTTIVFAINQLSPSSINISPLIIIHLRILLHSQVRSINLMMTGSLGFGSNN